MANKVYATEWLQKAQHDLTGARILYEADHYTDTIAYVLHQAIEKTLKSTYAYNNEAQRRTHNLVELYELIPANIDLTDEEVYLLSIATTYQAKQRYPVVPKVLPSLKEIEEILCFSEKLFERIVGILEIDTIEKSL
jgi:HEPN domain-containing protein